jgi:4-carboxymuconolactone decarboxylase
METARPNPQSLRGETMTEPIVRRILPLPREEWTDPAREVFAFWGEPNAWEEGSKTNIIMVLANHPKLAMTYSQWGKHFLMENSLNNRQQEIIILRVAWRVKSAYEWHNHVGYGMNAGLSLEEIAAVRDYPDSTILIEEESALIRACDELIDNNRVGDETWALLSTYFDRKQLMDLVFTIGHYVMTSWALSSFGVEIEGGADAVGFDLKTKSGQTPGKTYKPQESEDWIETRGY